MRSEYLWKIFMKMSSPHTKFLVCTMGKGEAMEGKSLEMISNKSLERSHVDLFENIYFSPSHAYIFAHSQCASLIFYL